MKEKGWGGATRYPGGGLEGSSSGGDKCGGGRIEVGERDERRNGDGGVRRGASKV